MSDFLALYDYRGRVGESYRRRNRAIWNHEDPGAICNVFREERDELFATHVQSSLDEEQRASFRGLNYFPYNPKFCVEVEIDPNVETHEYTIAMNAEESMTMTTAGQVHFSIDGHPATLSIYWLNIYGGGLFLPFKDETCPAESYGGGRYLFDTIKGSNACPISGSNGGQRILLDFNYAYNPSCAYNDRWVCPLAPLENRIPMAIQAGEKRYR